jgi:CHAD domain-containing protein
LTRRLGRVRELDVLLLLLDELQESGRYPGAALQRIKDEVAPKQEKARADLVDREIGADLRKVARKLERIVAALGEETDSPEQLRGLRWAVDARVTRRASALVDAMDEAGNVYLPERLHAVRIAVKKLRYAAEIAAEIPGVESHADVAILKRSQDLLGRLHDLQVLVDHVRQVQGSLTPPDVIAWRELDTVVAGLEASCRRLHARYVRERAALAELCGRETTRVKTDRAASTRKAG